MHSFQSFVASIRKKPTSVEFPHGVKSVLFLLRVMRRENEKDGETWPRVGLIYLLKQNYSKKLSWLDLGGLSCRNRDQMYNPNERRSSKLPKTAATDFNTKPTGNKMTWEDDSAHSSKQLIVCIVTQWRTDLWNRREPTMNRKLCSKSTPAYMKWVTGEYRA